MRSEGPRGGDMTSLCTCFCGVTWKGNSPQITCQGGQMGSKNSMGEGEADKLLEALGHTVMLPVHLCSYTVQLAPSQPAYSSSPVTNIPALVRPQGLSRSDWYVQN